MIRRLIPVAITLFATASCAAPSDDAQPESPPADEIVGGRSDKGKDPAVVALSLGGEALCTGSLIAPDVVLTARHCVSFTSEEVSCPSTGRQIEGDRDPSTIVVLIGDDASTATPVAAGKSIVVPAGDQLCGHDIALVHLDRPVEGVAPLEIDRGKGLAEGTTVRAVGFGRKADDGPAGKKRTRAHVAVLGATASELMVGEVTCSGDSGGPAIDEASGKIVGVLSRGGPGCQGPETRNIYTRPSAFLKLLPPSKP